MSGSNGHQLTEGRRVYLGMPGYGKQTASAARAFWRCCRDLTDQRRQPDAQPDKIWTQYHEGSLLAANFNALWCTALNLVHGGQPVDYFAMLHDDIGCEDYWLDKLIDELEACNLDILGVVSPIKDTRGMTSIALDNDNGDSFRPHCRLTMKEIYRLPETFTSEDVGRPLLLNTGAWVCRFDALRKLPLWFTIRDEIVWNRKTDRYEAVVESEDWYFSRRCHEHGLKIGCTRKVKMLHRGEMDFTNMQPWGYCDFDSAMIPASEIADRPADPTFPHDVNGWLSEDEGSVLSCLANGKRVLEIGSYCGRSTICLGRTAAFVLAVDPHDGRGTPNPKFTYDELRRNLRRYGVQDRVTIHVGTSQSVDDSYGLFDLAFIDGDHEADSVRSDIARARELLTPGGLLAFHDYRPAHDPYGDRGVSQAVDELLSAGGELLSVTDTVAVVRPPANTPAELCNA